MRVYANYGMGVDSTCILTRWLDEPETRDFDLGELTVLTAQTGDEFRDVKHAVETHMLPRLREHNIRYVQVSRSEGVKHHIVVLSDTRQPTELHIEGRFKLSDELLRAGTVASVANRRCSLKAKGEALDCWLHTDWQGAFRQVMGFNADEEKRVSRDGCYGGDNRNAEYPLMKWGWGRVKCEEYLRERYGIEWPKSCCWHCPFQRGTAQSLARMARHPEETANALFLEHMSLALNPLMPLFASGSLRDKLMADEANDHSAAFSIYRARLALVLWGVFRVRRVYHAKGRADRSIELVSGGKLPDVVGALNTLAENRGAEIVEGPEPIRRFYTARRQPNVYPTFEEMYVEAPAEAADKARKSFAATWNRVAMPVLS